jgi:hypothetical protein
MQYINIHVLSIIMSRDYRFFQSKTELCKEVSGQKNENTAALTESFPFQNSSKYNLISNFLLYRKKRSLSITTPVT